MKRDEHTSTIPERGRGNRSGGMGLDPFADHCSGDCGCYSRGAEDKPSLASHCGFNGTGYVNLKGGKSMLFPRSLSGNSILYLGFYKTPQSCHARESGGQILSPRGGTSEEKLSPPFYRKTWIPPLAGKSLRDLCKNLFHLGYESR